MADYREWFAFKEKTGSEITGVMRVHRYYYDAEEITDINELAINSNIGSVAGSWGCQLMSASSKSTTFIKRTIEIESTGAIVLEQYSSLTNYDPSSACADYGYTAVNNPVYYYTPPELWNHAIRPSSEQVGVTGGGFIKNIFYTPVDSETWTNLGTIYVALYGDDEQLLDFLLKYGKKPYVNWRIYCYNPSGNKALMNQRYDLTINWDFVIDDILKDYYEVESVVILLMPNPGSSSLLDTIIYNLDNIPNTFTILKQVCYPPITAIYYYNLNLYVKYKRLDNSTELQTDRFSIELDFLSNSVEDFENETTRIDNNDESTITFILKKPEDDENYNVIDIDSDDEKNPSDIDISDIVSNIGCGANMYALTKSSFSSLVTWLWTSTFIDNIKLINNSPIENIISAKLFPFTISTGSDTTITLGNVDTPILGEIIDSTFNRFYRQVVTSYTVEGYYGNFLDYSPYTSISIYLPYIGIKNLDTNMVVGKTLDIYYTFDLTSGAVVASIYVDGNNLYMFEGVIAVDLPMSSSNRAQVDATYVAIGASTVATIASAWVGASASIATASEKVAEKVTTNAITSASITTGKTALGSLIDSANVQFHTYTEGNFSPNTWGLLPKSVYMIYNRPTYQDIDTFRHVEGRHCMLSRNIGNLKGYTEVHSGIDLSGIPCDEELRARLKAILVGGFIA